MIMYSVRPTLSAVCRSEAIITYRQDFAFLSVHSSGKPFHASPGPCRGGEVQQGNTLEWLSGSLEVAAGRLPPMKVCDPSQYLRRAMSASYGVDAHPDPEVPTGL